MDNLLALIIWDTSLSQWSVYVSVVYSLAPHPTLLCTTCEFYSVPCCDFLCAFFADHFHTHSFCCALHNVLIHFASNNWSLFLNPKHSFLRESWLPTSEHNTCTLSFKPKIVVSNPEFFVTVIIFLAHLPHLHAPSFTPILHWITELCQFQHLDFCARYFLVICSASSIKTSHIQHFLIS